jgi:hypothetical protein
MGREEGKGEWRITRLISLMKGWMGGWKVVVDCREVNQKITLALRFS